MRPGLLHKYMSGAGIVVTANRISRFFAFVLAIAIVALVLAPAYSAAECTVHGGVYDWATFSTMNNVVVKVYSMQDMSLQGNKVAQGGAYSFSLPAGDYMIVATAGTQGSAGELTAVENLTVPASGERVIDLILFPQGNLDDLAGFTDSNVTTPTLAPTTDPTQAPVATPQPSQDDSALWLGGGAIALAIIAIAGGLILLRALKPKKPEYVKPPTEAPAKPVIITPAPEPVLPVEQEKPAEQPELPPPQPSVQSLLLPEDCRQVLAIIEKNDGRITQLDLRKMLPYSEAKVSLIVSDLESRGLVKKIKKGRGNVLILNRTGEQPPEK
jgi:uncharacterized membrane protein